MNNYRRFRCITARRYPSPVPKVYQYTLWPVQFHFPRFKSATKAKAHLKSPRHRHSWPPDGCENLRVSSLRNGEGEIWTTPRIRTFSKRPRCVNFRVLLWMPSLNSPLPVLSNTSYVLIIPNTKTGPHREQKIDTTVTLLLSCTYQANAFNTQLMSMRSNHVLLCLR
jgi:hypothetical protein